MEKMKPSYATQRISLTQRMTTLQRIEGSIELVYYSNDDFSCVCTARPPAQQERMHDKPVRAPAFVTVA